MSPAFAVDLKRFGPSAAGGAPPTLAEAQSYCRALARGHYENFVVGSLLLPRELKQHFYNVYAYCRWSDDLADETDPRESLELLDWWEDQLAACFQGRVRHPVFVALKTTIDEFGIPRGPFADLLVAFRQDQRVTRYATWDELWEYCRNSANPVGRLVLYLGRCHDEQRGRLADSVCTGLQLANFCQDVARDGQRGRVYLPGELLARHAVDEALLAQGAATPALREALREAVERAEELLSAGRPLLDIMPPHLAVDIELFIQGGEAILRAIRRVDYDVWTRRPTVSKAAQGWLLLRAVGRRWFSRPRASR